MKLNRISAGWYASEDGRFAVVSDGYGYVSQAAQDYTGCADDGWAAVYDARGRLRVNHNDGETLGWFSTKREAANFLEGVDNGT